MKTQKLFFPEDKTVDGVLTFKAGETYDIPVESGSYDRWVKRGALPVEGGYDPGKQFDNILDVDAGEVSHPAPEAALKEEVSSDEALAALGGDEEVANEDVKKENKKAKKSSK